MTKIRIHPALLPWYRARFWLAFLAGASVYLGTFLIASSGGSEKATVAAQLVPVGMAAVAALAVGFAPVLFAWLVARLWGAELDQRGVPLEALETAPSPPAVSKVRRLLRTRLRRPSAPVAAGAQPTPRVDPLKPSEVGSQPPAELPVATMAKIRVHPALLPWYRARFWLAFLAGAVVYLGTFLIASSGSSEKATVAAQLVPVGIAIVAALAVGFAPVLFAWLVARLWRTELEQQGVSVEALESVPGPAAVSSVRKLLRTRLRRPSAPVATGAHPTPQVESPKAPVAEPRVSPLPVAPIPREEPEPEAGPVSPLRPPLDLGSLTPEELAATEAVLRGVTAPSGPEPMSASARSVFHCLQCGAEMGPEEAQCPVCHVRYLPEEAAVAEEDLTADEAALLDLLDAQLLVHKERSPIIHFDAESGRISYLDETIGPNVELAFECDSCGAVVSSDFSRCPSCGAVFEGEGTGILDLVADLEFAEAPEEILCPSCGAKTPFASLSCLSCGTSLDDPHNRALVHLVPLIDSPGVIFVHLDVQNGRVSYLQRGAGVQGRIYQEETIQLERLGREKFDQKWKGLGRI